MTVRGNRKKEVTVINENKEINKYSCFLSWEQALTIRFYMQAADSSNLCRETAIDFLSNNYNNYNLLIGIVWRNQSSPIFNHILYHHP